MRARAFRGFLPFSVMLALAVSTVAIPAVGQTLTGTIVFDSPRSSGVSQIHSMSANGKNLIRLNQTTNDETHPSWSPDGSKILFVSTINYQSTLYRMDSNGANRTVLATSTGQFYYPSYSPDGRWIAFGGSDGLFVIDLWARRPAPVLILSQLGLTVPAWSPDSHQIAFSYNTFFGSLGDIFKINPDGTGLINVTNTPNVGETYPAWSGDQIAFIQGSGPWFGDLCVMNSDGSNRRQLTTGNFAYARPGWSPNGEWIAFSALAYNNHYGLFAATPGGYIVPLNLYPGDDINPSWKR